MTEAQSGSFYDEASALEWLCSHPPCVRLDGDNEGASGAFFRSLGNYPLSASDINVPLCRQNYFSQKGLAAQRLLLNIYHNDFVFLPKTLDDDEAAAFNAFYMPATRIAGQILRPSLEQFVFRMLDDRQKKWRGWTVAESCEYLRSLSDQQGQLNSNIVKIILQSTNPERAAKNLLAQFSIDFLCEGSAIARKVMGNYGCVQSALFQILIDEYGEGIYRNKHSTLYEVLLRSYGLNAEPNGYWELCLISSLAVPNLFQYLSSDHRKTAQYMGAVYYAETVYYHFCGQISMMLKRVFGPNAETRYFDEHYVVDQNHSRMAFENIVLPLVRQYGRTGAERIVEGYEQYRVINELLEKDFADQLWVIDHASELYRQADALNGLIGGATPNTAEKPARWSSVGCVWDADVVYVLRSGDLSVVLGYECDVSLRLNQGIIIPQTRLHSLMSSMGCTFDTYSLDGSAKQLEMGCVTAEGGS